MVKATANRTNRKQRQRKKKRKRKIDTPLFTSREIGVGVLFKLLHCNCHLNVMRACVCLLALLCFRMEFLSLNFVINHFDRMECVCMFYSLFSLLPLLLPMALLLRLLSMWNWYSSHISLIGLVRFTRFSSTRAVWLQSKQIKWKTEEYMNWKKERKRYWCKWKIVFHLNWRYVNINLVFVCYFPYHWYSPVALETLELRSFRSVETI